MKKNRFNRFLSLFLAFIMTFGYLTPIAEVFAANTPYGTNYPAYSSQFPNTIIVNDNGTYVAFQTSSNIYYASDKQYVMVGEQVPVQKLIWTNGTWVKNGVYTPEIHIRDVQTDAGTTIHLYNITNEKVNGQQKTYGIIVDCNVSIYNYNSDPAVSAGVTKDSTPQEIADWGLIMAPSPYEMITFSDGDSQFEIREDFSLMNSFSIKDLTFNLKWKVESGDSLRISNGSGDVDSVFVTRPYNSYDDCVLSFSVEYVLNGQVLATSTNSYDINVRVLPRGYIDNDNVSNAELEEWLLDLPDFTSLSNNFIKFASGDSVSVVNPGNKITISAKASNKIKITKVVVNDNSANLSSPVPVYEEDDDSQQILSAWEITANNSDKTMKYASFTITVVSEENPSLTTDVTIPILVNGEAVTGTTNTTANMMSMGINALMLDEFWNDVLSLKIGNNNDVIKPINTNNDDNVYFVEIPRIGTAGDGETDSQYTYSIIIDSSVEGFFSDGDTKIDNVQIGNANEDNAIVSFNHASDSGVDDYQTAALTIANWDANGELVTNIAKFKINDTDFADYKIPLKITWDEVTGEQVKKKSSELIIVIKDINAGIQFYDAGVPTDGSGTLGAEIESKEIATQVADETASHYVIVGINNNSKITPFSMTNAILTFDDSNLVIKNFGEVNIADGKYTYDIKDSYPEISGGPNAQIDLSVSDSDVNIEPNTSKYFLLYIKNIGTLKDESTINANLSYNYSIYSASGEKFEQEINYKNQAEDVLRVTTTTVPLSFSGFKVYNDTDVTNIVRVLNVGNDTEALLSEQLNRENIIASLKADEFNDNNADGVYSSLSLDNYDTSTYYALMLKNVNAVDATNINLSLTADDEFSKVEFVGKIEISDDSTKFVEFDNKANTLNIDTISKNTIDETVSTIYLIRIATTKTASDENNTVKVSINGTGTIDGTAAKFDNITEHSFSVTENPYTNFVSAIANILENDKSSVVNNDKVNTNNSYYKNNYLFISNFADGDVLTDVTHDFNLVTSYADTSITWSIERVGNGDAIASIKDGNTVHIDKRGTKDTVFVLTATFSRNSVTKTGYISFKVPAISSQKFVASTEDLNAQMDYIGAYLKTDTGYVVLGNLQSVFGSKISSLPDSEMDMIIDNNKTYSFTLFYRTISPENGWTLPFNNVHRLFKFENDSTPNGSKITNYGTDTADLTVVPSTINFESEYKILTEGQKSNTLNVKFTKGTSFAYADGELYKTMTYVPTQLFLDKYILPDFVSDNVSAAREPFSGLHVIVLNTGENVLMLKSSNEWVIRDNESFSPAKTGFSDVDVYVYSGEWVKVTTLTDIDATSKFGNFSALELGDGRSRNPLNALIFASDDIYSANAGEGDSPILKANSYTSILGNNGTYSYIYTPRIFAAKGLSLPSSAGGNLDLNLDGEKIDALYYVNESTYFAVREGKVNVYNAISENWSGWINPSDIGMTIEAVESFTLINYESDKWNAAYSIGGINKNPAIGACVPIVSPTQDVFTNGNNKALFIAQPNNGIKMITYTGNYSISGGKLVFSPDSNVEPEEFVMTDYSWKKLGEEETLLKNNVYEDKNAQYSILFNGELSSSGSTFNFTGDEIIPIRVNMSGYKNLPRPTNIGSGSEAIMIYDGQYKILVGNVPFTINDRTKEVEMEVTEGTPGTITAYVYSSDGTWVRNTASDASYVDSDKDGVVSTGIYKHEIIWNNNTLMYTKSTSQALSGLGMSAMSQSATGMIDLATKTSASSLPYYIWDTKNPKATFLIRLDAETTTGVVPLFKPDSTNLIKTSNNPTPAGSDRPGEYTNTTINMELYIPDFDNIVKFAKIVATKTIPDGQEGSTISIKDYQKYETNIDKWFGDKELTEDRTPPKVQYGYMLYKTIKWVGQDGYYTMDEDGKQIWHYYDGTQPDEITEEISGLNSKYPYGILFETDFPIAGTVTGYTFDENTKTFTMVTYTDNNSGERAVIPAGTTLWFPTNEIDVWNYSDWNEDENTYEDIQIYFMVMDDNYNISDPVKADVIKEDDNHKPLTPDVPDEIQNQIDAANKPSGTTDDIDPPTIEAIYMYKGYIYITGQDLSVDGRDISGLAPYPYIITVDRDKPVELADANDAPSGLGGKITTLTANVKTYSAVSAIPLGDLNIPLGVKISMIDNAGNAHEDIEFSIDKFDDNTVLYGTVPDYIQRLLDAAKGESVTPGEDLEPPTIIAAYVNGVAEPSTLNVIAEDNSGGQLYYKFVLRATGETAWSTTPYVELQTKDSGVARIYVKDEAGNEASCTVFINASESEIVYGDEGDIPPEIMDEIKLEKKDNTPPVITSIYVYNGRLYVKGYDDVRLHDAPYGWTPQEDMIIGSNFTGTTSSGEYINIPGGSIVKNGTEIWNSTNSMEIMIPMSFTVSLRDASGNITSRSFFISKDNVLLEGTAPPEIEHILDTGEVKDSKFDVNQDENKINVGMASDFKSMNWEQNDYRVEMFTSDGRLIYSITMDIGGSVIIPLFTEGETVTIVETVIDEVSQVEVMQVKQEFEIADNTPPVITNVYVMSEKLYVEAYDDIDIGTEPYSFAIENVVNPTEERFSATNSIRIMPGDNVIIKVKDEAGNSTSMTVFVSGAEQTILKNLNPRNPIVVNSGDSKSLVEWDIFFKKYVTIPYGYELNMESSNSVLRPNASDGVISGEAYGVVEYYNKDTDEYLHIAVKIEDSGKTGRTNIVQTNSITNFVLLFEDTMSKIFGTQNGVYWEVVDQDGLRKEGEYVRALKPGIYKIIATKGDQNISFYLLVEDRMDMNLTPLTFDSPEQKYTYLVGTNLLYEEIFDVTSVPEAQLQQVIDRIIVEEASDGLTCSNGQISLTSDGRKKVVFIDLLTDESYTFIFESIKLYYGIGAFADAANSYAKENISLLSQVGAFEENHTGKFMPINPISMKEFISNINRLSMIYDCGIDYAKTDMSVNLVTRDWDFYNVYNFLGYCNNAAIIVIEENILTKPITRGDAAVILEQSIMKNQPYRSNLADVASDIMDSATSDAVSHLCSLGIISLPADKTFRPDDELTREEMATMLGNAVKYLR